MEDGDDPLDAFLIGSDELLEDRLSLSGRELPGGPSPPPAEHRHAPALPSTRKDTPTSCGGTRKRRTSSIYNIPKRVRLQGCYNDDYRTLLNQEITDVVDDVNVGSDDGLLPPSQVGLSKWTSEEKATFFDGLARLGKDNLPGIAALIGTKSIHEIKAYQRLLHEGFVYRHLDTPRSDLLGLSDFPVALEISQQCCDALERAADALSMRQENFEIAVESKKWGDVALLNAAIAERLEQSLNESEAGDNGFVSKIPCAGLLNLGKWLELSENVFMNVSAPQGQDHWSLSAGDGEGPSIMHTAFTEFHELAVSITKRLVQSSLYYAMSRLRATDAKGFNNPRLLVRRIDVEAACNVLGMRDRWRSYWRGVPRRVGLSVYSRKSVEGHRRTKNVFINLDEAERLLGYNVQDETLYATTTSEALRTDIVRPVANRSRWDLTIGPSPKVKIEAPSSPGSSSHETSSATSSESSLGDVFTNAKVGSLNNSESFDEKLDNPHTSDNRVLDRILKQRRLHEQQDEYAEANDQCVSRAEEERLWQMLRLPSPPNVNSEGTLIPVKPRQERKIAQDLVDWRERTEYRAPWEKLNPFRTLEETPLDASEAEGQGSAREGADRMSLAPDMKVVVPPEPRPGTPRPESTFIPESIATSSDTSNTSSSSPVLPSIPKPRPRKSPQTQPSQSAAQSQSIPCTSPSALRPAVTPRSATVSPYPPQQASIQFTPINSSAAYRSPIHHGPQQPSSSGSSPTGSSSSSSSESHSSGSRLPPLRKSRIGTEDPQREADNDLDEKDEDTTSLSGESASDSSDSDHDARLPPLSPSSPSRRPSLASRRSSMEGVVEDSEEEAAKTRGDQSRADDDDETSSAADDEGEDVSSGSESDESSEDERGDEEERLGRRRLISVEL
ncbi:MAG: hypothetical protein M1833_000532 [Piccolia ochrophora]|nr:MAG: hypothetical protein M1833_000532 [Piccolia ochrophora]